MSEPALNNNTAFRVNLLPILDRYGVESRIAIVKASYCIGDTGELKLSDDQREIRLGDEMWGPPEVADIRLPGDFCADKPGTDFILSGYAMQVRRIPSEHVDVSIRVGDRNKILRAHGPR